MFDKLHRILVLLIKKFEFEVFASRMSGSEFSFPFGVADTVTVT